MSQCEWPSTLLDWQKRHQKKRERKSHSQVDYSCWLGAQNILAGWDERLLLRMHQDKSWNTICWRWRKAWSVSSGCSLGKQRVARVCDGRNVLSARQNVRFFWFFGGLFWSRKQTPGTDGLCGTSKCYHIILDDWSEVDFNLPIFSHMCPSKGTSTFGFL